MSSSPCRENPKKILIITSSGGGGLIQTANAKEQESREKYPGVEIVRKDLLKDWVWKPMGRCFINLWNQSQRRGNVAVQRIWVSSQFLADFFLHIPLFFRALYELFKEDADHIIDTQVLGTAAIVKALRIYNWKKGKNVRLEKVLVDLPTRKATHFFRPIKQLSKENRKLVVLTSISPLLAEGETAEEFWQSTCGLSARSINLEEVYVRKAFQFFKGKKRTQEGMVVSVRCKNQEEFQLMQKSFRKGSIDADVMEEEVAFRIHPQDRMFTVLLGSQPASEATLNYVKQWILFAKECPKMKMHLFVFCADHAQGESSLFREVADFVARTKNYPKHFSVIPFSFQNEDVIAPLFFRSDITCTRSGGQTAMELMCVSTGEIWIHSEAKKGQGLLSGIPGWEGASAVYLQKVRGAKICTPDTIMSHVRAAYQTGSEQSVPTRALESTA